MSDTLGLPPYGPIPDDVRDRVRKTVQKRIRRPKYRTPLLVAAGVAVLAAGAVFVTTSPSPPSEPAQPAPSDPALDRCWAAIQQTGKTALYPERSKWRAGVVALPKYTPQTVVGVASDKQPFFCQTTDNSVTVSAPTAQPRYAQGSKTAALLMMDGLIAGVVDPSWPAALVTLQTGSQGVFPASDGMFIYEADVYRNEGRPITVSKVERDYELPTPERPAGAELPSPEAPAISYDDRPPPPQDRTSQTGKALGECLAKSGSQFVFDQHSYGPGATITRDKARIIMARSATRTGVCLVSPVRGFRDMIAYFMGPTPAQVTGDKPISFHTGGVNLANGSRDSYGGIVPMNTARMVVRFGNGVEVEPAVANGTFITILPDNVVVDGSGRVPSATTAKLFDGNGSMIYSGPVNFWEPSR